MAYHGGHLEWMTDVIAHRAAERSDASFYAVIQPEGMKEHFPSTTVDRTHSSALADFLDHVDIVIGNKKGGFVFIQQRKTAKK